MTVKISKDEDYVEVEQRSYFDRPTKLRPDEARDLADNLKELAEEVDDG
jgi:hypothetical protein